MPKVTLETIGSGVGTATLHNSNFQTIEDAFENTMSRDGSSPNHMLADFDLNNKDLINVKTVNADAVKIGGQSIVPGNALTIPSSVNVPYTPAGTGAVESDVQTKLRESVSVKDFGAVGNGVVDDTLAIQAGIEAVSAAGGGVLFFPPGDYVAMVLTLASNVTLQGAGRAVSRLVIPTGNTTQNAIVRHVSGAVENVTFDALGFRGRWDEIENQIEANGLLTAKFVTGLRIKDCGFYYAAAFSINVNECDLVEVVGCELKNGARDMIAVWGTPRVKITGNTLLHNDDDGISVNWETEGSDPVRSGILISNNILEDTGPIRTQAPKNVVITNNVISRTKGAGIRAGVTNFSMNDISSGHAVLITDNVITDVIDRQWFVSGEQTGSLNNRVYIDVQSIPTQDGSLTVAPGEVDPAAGTVQSPYDWFYKRADTDPESGSIRAPETLIVSRNICKRTLPAVTNYSDWGYGEAFALTGMVDYQVTESVLAGIGVRVLLPQTGLLIDSNIIETYGEGIRFDLETGVTIADHLLKSARVSDNKIRSCVLAGVQWVPSTFSQQDIVFRGNTVDCDPFFLSANRASGGAWTSGTGGPTAFRLNQIGGVMLLGNEVRNAAATLDQTGASAHQYVQGNMVVADATSAGFNAANKGVGNVPPISGGDAWWIQFRDSDPTSATYNDSLGANIRNSIVMPTSGKWLSGMVVGSRDTTVRGTAGSRYIILGWVRLTSGSNHVLDTDWSEMRVLTGT